MWPWRRDHKEEHEEIERRLTELERNHEKLKKRIRRFEIDSEAFFLELQNEYDEQAA